jgi:hypothetical protein
VNLGYVLTYAKIGGLFRAKLRSLNGLFKNADVFLSNCKWKVVFLKFVGLSVKIYGPRVQFHEVEGLVCGQT